MERSDNSDKMAIFIDICCSLLMLILGLVFCFPLATLTYFTYQTITGSRQFCTLWIDVPGRFVILLTCYYIASICGFLPLPQRYHLYSFIVPFNVWSLRSWRCLFRNMCFGIPPRSLITRLHQNVSTVQESVETPLLGENRQNYLYTTSPRRRHTTPINIPYPESYKPSVFISDPEITPRNETPGIIKSSNGSISSIDPSVGDIVLPIMPKKSPKRYYISEVTIKEYESVGDRDRVESKYRKRFTELKWPGEASGITLAPRPDYQATTRERPVILTPDKKSTSLTDDEQLAISRRQERRGLGTEIPEVHIKKNIEPVPDVKSFASDSAVASERPLYDKYFEHTDEESLLNTGQEELPIFGNEIPKLETRNELLSETDQSRDEKKKLHLEGAYNNKRETPPEYRNNEAQFIFPEIILNRNNQLQAHATDLAVAREWLLEDKYFGVTEETHVTIGQQELQISGDERPKENTADGRIIVLTRNELLPEKNDQPTVHRRNLYPGESSCSNLRAVPLESSCTEAQSTFTRAHRRNQQSRPATIIKEQEISSKFRSAETQMKVRGTLSRNQQSDERTSSSEREREFIFPEIILNRNHQPETHATDPAVAREWLLEDKYFEVTEETLVTPRQQELQISGGVRPKENTADGRIIVQTRNELLPEKNDQPTVDKRNLYPGESSCSNQRAAPLENSCTEAQSTFTKALRSQSVIETRLTRSYENINRPASSSFRIENSSTSVKSSDKHIKVKPMTSSNAVEGNSGQTANLYNGTHKEARVSMSFSHAMNLSSSLVDRATCRRRTLPSLRFEAYVRTGSQIQNKTEVKRSVKHEKCTASDETNSERRMTDEAAASNLSTFEENTERTGMGTPVTGETSNESFNSSQLDMLRKKLTLVKQSRSHLNSEASASVELNQRICTKTTDKNKDIRESNVSMKPSGVEAAKKPYVKIIIDSPLITSESDSDSESERSK